MEDERPHNEDEPEHEDLYELQEEEPAARRKRLDADFLLDKVIPDEIDWRDLVRRHRCWRWAWRPGSAS